MNRTGLAGSCPRNPWHDATGSCRKALDVVTVDRNINSILQTFKTTQEREAKAHNTANYNDMRPYFAKRNYYCDGAKLQLSHAKVSKYVSNMDLFKLGEIRTHISHFAGD